MEARSWGSYGQFPNSQLPIPNFFDMTDDKWADIIDRITERFGIIERGEAPLLEVPNGKREFIVFHAPIGDVRLSRVSKPRTTGQRTVGGSRRIGGAIRVEMTYDLHDMMQAIEAERWDAAKGAWVPMRPDAFS
ncbi:hypothetical protein HY480_01990 [Candidatus Uhrbacteria bacterium]|nr:hypothetical protein [Candidatus Uhrbacteria bacterium]